MISKQFTQADVFSPTKGAGMRKVRSDYREGKFSLQTGEAQ